MKLKPIAIAASAVVASLTLPAYAQQQSAQLERVEVTGSRIMTLNAESAAPVQVLTASDIAASGATNISELLQKNPVFGVPPLSRNNSNFQTSSAGVATVDLRFLGSDRTLVLVNGRRFVAGVPGSSTVDLNTIPTDFIERVEILTGGASSTYGSDAVAGVVNIILKRNFEGVLMSAEVGQSQKGDDDKRKFGITFGTGGDKGNLMAHFSVTRQGAVYSKDRENSAIDQISEALLTGDAADLFKVRRPFFSSFAPQGRFYWSDTGNYTYDKAGNPIPFSANGPKGDGVGATGFNRTEYRTIAIPTDRMLISTKGDYNIAENHQAYFEATYAATRTKTRLEPFPLDSGGSNGVYKGTLGWAPAEFRIGNQIVRNAMVPDYLYNQLSDQDGDGLKDYKFTRRLSDIAMRTAKADRDTFRVVGGFKGELTKTWSYDAYALYGSTKEAQTSTGQVNLANFRSALEAIVDVNDLNGNGSKTDLICRDANARAEGCVPMNIFGYNSISPEASKYVSADGSLSTKLTQTVVGASVNGEPFDLPAGPLGLAFGAEYRRETSRTEFDALTQSGQNGGNALPNASGKFDVKEVFAEARIPLLSKLPLVKRLDANLALRHGNYSTVGSVNSWSTGLDWAVNNDFRLRATHSLSTRAPNIGELYNPPGQTFPSGLTDPCEGVKATDSSAVALNCLKDPGVAANVAKNGEFTLNQADVQGISGFDIGNRTLKQEKGKSTTLGLVVTPKSIDLLRNFTFAVDYWYIAIEDAIDAPDRQLTLDQCYGAGNQALCKFIKRRAVPAGSNSAGSIEFIDALKDNSAGRRRQGLDLTATYIGKLGPGAFNASVAWTRMLSSYDQPLPVAPRDYVDGEVGSPRDRVMINLGYKLGNWGANVMTTYIAASAIDDQLLKSLGAERNQYKVPSKTYVDAQVQYQWGKAQLYLGIDNLLNTKAPLMSGIKGSDTGTETNAATYDPIGRRYYAGVRYKF